MSLDRCIARVYNHFVPIFDVMATFIFNVIDVCISDKSVEYRNSQEAFQWYSNVMETHVSSILGQPRVHNVITIACFVYHQLLSIDILADIIVFIIYSKHNATHPSVHHRPEYWQLFQLSNIH